MHLKHIPHGPESVHVLSHVHEVTEAQHSKSTLSVSLYFTSIEGKKGKFNTSLSDHLDSIFSISD